ncbi:MAG: hypothetical protein IIC75_02190 [Bacteroidetes bacterium]|nr:hypothetical protein [Bacteroidota bacterium]
MEILIGLTGLIISIVLFMVGKRHGEKLEQKRYSNERALTKDERLHELASKVADEYVKMTRSRKDNGLHAMATLALHLLKSDTLIREAINEMHLRSGHNPWYADSKYIEDVDLVRFFEYVSENKINFFKASVADVAIKVKELGGIRKNVTA